MLQYNQITDTIAELLLAHDCVIVPNFGGFVARNHSAGFGKGNHLLFPPAKHVLFNKQLIHHDGLLVSALMNKNNLSYQEAEKWVADYKDYIQSLLSVKKRFELGTMGLLYIDGERNLRFEAKTDVNFLLESFGLEPVVANELAIEPEKVAISTAFEDRMVSGPHTPPQKHKKSYRLLAAMAVAIPVTLTFLLFAAYSKPVKPFLQSSLNPFYTPERTYISYKTTYSRKVLLIDNYVKQPLLADANGFASLQLSNNGPVLIASINEFQPKTDKTSVHKASHHPARVPFVGKFQVVMGCFGVEQNANKLIRELNTKQITAGISGKNAKGLFVVSCGGFEGKEEAIRLLSSIKANYPNAWVMTK